MRYGSVSTGLSAASVAWRPMGWEPVWFSEINPFCNKVLKYHYPEVPNLGDMCRLDEQPYYHEQSIDVLEGGTPCQGFSLAGLRGGLADKRSNLALEFCRILITKQPRWFVWENVPGVLSAFSDEAEGGEEVWQTSDFATLLEAFRKCGYSCAYRVFDSQYFGVPQRRRRVFVVGYLGNDWRPPFAVLFERESLRRDFTPSKKKRKEAAGQVVSGATTTGTLLGNGAGLERVGGNHNEADMLVSLKWPADVAPTLDATFAKKWGQDNQHIKAGAGLFVPIKTYTHPNQRTGLKEEDISNAIKTSFDGSEQNCGALVHVVCVDARNGIESEVVPTIQSHHSSLNSIPLVYDPSKVVNNDGQNPDAGLVAPTLTTVKPHIVVMEKIRRITPLECERLQGFPDNYTKIPGAKDSPRYMALGNSITTHVIGWIGRRIDKVDKLLRKL